MIKLIMVLTAIAPPPTSAASPLRLLQAETPAPQASNSRTYNKKRSPAASKLATAERGRMVSIDGQSYRSLDEYLAKLERDGWVGKPWYKELEPGRYELVTNLRPLPAKRIFTRAELESQFGFSE